jgi:hypothetical protein
MWKFRIHGCEHIMAATLYWTTHYWSIRPNLALGKQIKLVPQHYWGIGLNLALWTRINLFRNIIGASNDLSLWCQIAVIADPTKHVSPFKPCKSHKALQRSADGRQANGNSWPKSTLIRFFTPFNGWGIINQMATIGQTAHSSGSSDHSTDGALYIAIARRLRLKGTQ